MRENIISGEFPAMYIKDAFEAEISGDIPINCYKQNPRIWMK
jgi:hypothetical protein